MGKVGDKVSQRINDQVIEYILASPDLYSDTMVKLCMDLRDARTRIAELEALSSSQEQAHALRDAGGRV